MSWGQNSHKRDDELKAAAEYGRRTEPLPDIHLHAVLTAADADYGDELRDRRARQEHLEREIIALGRRLAAPLGDERPKRRWFSRAGKGEKN